MSHESNDGKARFRQTDGQPSSIRTIDDAEEIVPMSADGVRGHSRPSVGSEFAMFGPPVAAAWRVRHERG